MMHLAQESSLRGLTVKSVPLEGRFHSSVHEGIVEEIDRVCALNSDFQLPTADRLLIPLRNNTDGQIIREGSLHRITVRSILCERSNWYQTIAAAALPLNMMGNPSVLAFGSIDCIPSSVVREQKLRVTKLDGSKLLTHTGNMPDTDGAQTNYQYPDHAIAVVGMACRFPGADSVDEFWEVIRSGASMVQEVPAQRFSTKGLRRTENPKSRFWGNFVHDIDAFDNRFFKKSSREAVSMDPQQRLLYQVAYEAMESSGYFGELSRTKDDVGCYIGVGATDYNDNVTSHPPTAFSALGTLRAFLSGKLSHYFGWTGPSITYDTACSSSAVAINAACKAIETGECSEALAGGVNLITSPNLFQNLMAANFLSPTGASKSFDAGADGYCRGEGIGLVVLKKMTQALLDDDEILGVIAGSAVNQNSNSTSITVPHSPSQIKLYRRVCDLAGIRPENVSYVEAHGTGTPVGDPIEYESIRQVFGGSRRNRKLHIGSVKGNIGHTEGASGVAALIKTILMLQHQTIPLQANFTTLNPKIKSLEGDEIAIPKVTQLWNSELRIACTNNYGAAGSNAAMIVCQAPSQKPTLPPIRLPRYPIYLSASSTASLELNCSSLRKSVTHQPSMLPEKDLMASISFSLADKVNRSLPYALITTAANISDLDSQLTKSAAGSRALISQVTDKARPIVLVFSGQTSRTLGLNPDIYHSSILFRSHLDHCDQILQSHGIKTLFPEIFSREPVEDIVSLHCMIFSFQYACAKSWMDCGLHINTVIGHSFGQLTALCVCGRLSLEGGLEYIAGRASLIRENWCQQRGSMCHVEADINSVSRILSSVASDPDRRVEVACYNGPTSHVLAGTDRAIELLESTIASLSFPSPIKIKKLDVTHGYHSRLVDSLIPSLIELAEKFDIHGPSSINLETCSDGQAWTTVEPRLIAEHTRSPVYFGQATRRISQRLGQCTWLEVGPGSSATGLVRRALGTSTTSSDLFQPVPLGTPDALQSLVDATVSLWRAGHKVQFWPFHSCQRRAYSPLSMPPYQFEKPRHWLPYLDSAHEAFPQGITETEPKIETRLVSLVTPSDPDRNNATFSVDPRNDQFRMLVLGHAVLGHPLCPVALYAEIITSAVILLAVDPSLPNGIPNIEDLDIKSPLGADMSRAIKLTLQKSRDSLTGWTFILSSQAWDPNTKYFGSKTEHALGKISLRLPNEFTLLAEFARFEKLIGSSRVDAIASDPGSEKMQGSLIYKVFSKAVTYKDYYQGVRRVSSKDNEVVGSVTMPPCEKETLIKTSSTPIAIDNFLQVAGIHVNSLRQCNDNEVFVATKIAQILPGPDFSHQREETRAWLVYSSLVEMNDKEVINDIFVFDCTSKKLVMIILGAQFTRIAITSLVKVLARTNPTQSSTAVVMKKNATVGTTEMPVLSVGTSIIYNENAGAIKRGIERNVTATPNVAASDNLNVQVCKILAAVTDNVVDTIGDKTLLGNLGIDSLMVTEVLSEIRNALMVDVPLADFVGLQDIRSLCDYLSHRVSGPLTALSRHTTGSSSEDDSPSVSISPASTVTPTSDIVTETSESLLELVSQHLETTAIASPETSLADAGLDSLLSTELAKDIEKFFQVQLQPDDLNGEITFGDLLENVLSQKSISMSNPKTDHEERPPSPKILSKPQVSLNSLSQPSSDARLAHAHQAFEETRLDYDSFAEQTEFSNFWTQVYPKQSRLVLAYVVEAFANLGCDLVSMRPGQKLFSMQSLPKHRRVMSQFYDILQKASLIDICDSNMIRTDVPIDKTPAITLHEEIIQAFPCHVSEHQLLHITGSRLGECLSGKIDPLQLMFRRKEDRDLMEDVYTNAPMFAAGTRLLGSFLAKAFVDYRGQSTFHILELGGGTAGTTKYVVDHLLAQGLNFTYTFTDISASLVAAAKKKFAGLTFMEFLVLDIENAPSQQYIDRYHVIISTNCIHATKNLTHSSTNMRKMMRSDGIVALVELTRNIPWFDLVFGLLDGWWLFEDGRTHALADVSFWHKSFTNAGFGYVAWSGSDTLESRTLRIIIASASESPARSLVARKDLAASNTRIETQTFKQVNESTLYADIYLPSNSQVEQPKRPIGMNPVGILF